MINFELSIDAPIKISVAASDNTAFDMMIYHRFMRCTIISFGQIFFFASQEDAQTLVTDVWTNTTGTSFLTESLGTV